MLKCTDIRIYTYIGACVRELLLKLIHFVLAYRCLMANI